jgi:hypothetical protein
MQYQDALHEQCQDVLHEQCQDALHEQCQDALHMLWEGALAQNEQDGQPGIHASALEDDHIVAYDVVYYGPQMDHHLQHVDEHEHAHQ